jgi:aryl-alcohol dehydrogenase-like predicted oxidoreductase
LAGLEQIALSTLVQNAYSLLDSAGEREVLPLCQALAVTLSGDDRAALRSFFP